MNYAIAKVSIATVYKAPHQRSELLTQVLFGEVVEVLEHKSDLLYIRCTWDDMTGWARPDQFTFVDTDTAIELLQDPSVSLSLVESIMAADHFIPITIGASLPKFDGVSGAIPDLQFKFGGNAVKPGTIEIKLQWVEKLVLRYLHAPELHGGRSPFGIDSSGLAQMCYKMLGISLPRGHEAQVRQGRNVEFMEFCQPGDLAYFDDGRGNIGHVGVILSDCSIIHVEGRVRKDKLDHFGIWNADTNRYTWQLRVVKRHLSDFPEEAMLSRTLKNESLKGAHQVTEDVQTPGMFDF